jgi:hypothetical protein
LIEHLGCCRPPSKLQGRYGQLSEQQQQQQQWAMEAQLPTGRRLAQLML